MQLLDMYVIVLPSLHQAGFHPSLFDLLALVGIGGILGWLLFRVPRHRQPFPDARPAPRRLDQAYELATMARVNPTRTPSGILTFFGGLILLAVFAFLVVWWVRGTGKGDVLGNKRGAARYEARKKLEDQHHAQLTTLGWVDKAKGIAHVPVEDAMKLTLTELKGRKVEASTVKVEPPLPVVVPDPNSTEPPPSPMPSAPQGADTMRFDVVKAAATPTPPPAPALEAAPKPAATPAPKPAATPAPVPPAATPAPKPPATPVPAPPAATPPPKPPATPIPAPPTATPAPKPAATPAPSTPAPAPPAPPAATPPSPAPATPPPAPATPAPAAASNPPPPVNLTPQLSPVSNSPTAP